MLPAEFEKQLPPQSLEAVAAHLTRVLTSSRKPGPEESKKMCSGPVRVYQIGCAMFFYLTGIVPSIAQQSANVIAPAAKTYLNRVLDLMEQNAFHKRFIDWSRVRREAFARAADAQTTFDAYPAI